MGAPLKSACLRTSCEAHLHQSVWETGDVYLVADDWGTLMLTLPDGTMQPSDSRKREASRRISLPDLDNLDTSKENIPLKDT